MMTTLLTPELLVQYQDSYIYTMNVLVPTSYDDVQLLLESYIALTQQGTQVYVVIDDELGIVWSISLFIEAKMIRWWVKAGHIEDLVVHDQAQGQGIWWQLIETALQAALDAWCYKVILDCDDELVWYYESKGFESNGVFMRRYM